MLFYFSLNSAIIILMAIISMAVLWWYRGDELAPPPSRSVFDEGDAMPRRAGWLPYWGVAGLMASLIVRSVTGHGVVMAVITALAMVAAWRWASPIFYRYGGRESTTMLAVAVGVGFFLGWIIRGTGLWPSMISIVAATLAAVMVHRPVESGFLNKP